MACRPAPAALAAIRSADAIAPSRNKLSDGICPSPQHTAANPNSSHEQGNAADITHDPGAGIDGARIAELARLDPRARYVIHNRRIGDRLRGWRRYDGPNPHTTHVHIDIVPALRNDASPWFGQTIPAASSTGVQSMTSTAGRSPASILADGSTWVRVTGVIVGLAAVAAGAGLIIAEQNAGTLAGVARLTPVGKAIR